MHTCVCGGVCVKVQFMYVKNMETHVFSGPLLGPILRSSKGAHGEPEILFAILRAATKSAPPWNLVLSAS